MPLMRDIIGQNIISARPTTPPPCCAIRIGGGGRRDRIRPQANRSSDGRFRFQQSVAHASTGADELNFHRLAEQKCALVNRRRLQAINSVRQELQTSESKVAATITQQTTKKTVASMEQSLSPPPLVRAGRAHASRARLGISNVSIPLMWRDTDHFKNKGDPRAFSVFLVLQVGNEVKESRLVPHVNRTCTDVTLVESFEFENVNTDFGLDVAVYAARTDSTDLNGTLRRRFLKGAMTRSLGRKFGSSVKSQMTTSISDECHQENGGSGAFRLIGRCFLRLVDAAQNIKIHDLQVAPDAEFYSPPLYGHICCRMVLLPNSVAMPLIEGTLTIRPLNEAKIFQNVHCRLQGGQLRCSGGIVSRPSLLANFRIDANSMVQLTRQPTTVMLTARGDSGRRKQLMMTAESAESLRSWKCALEQQIADCSKWGSFASQPVQLDSHTHAQIHAPLLPKGDGKRLYDQISITGDPPPSHMTLPVKRPIRISRTSVKNLFPDVHYPGSGDSLDSQEQADLNSSYHQALQGSRGGRPRAKSLRQSWARSISSFLTRNKQVSRL